MDQPEYSVEKIPTKVSKKKKFNTVIVIVSIVVILVLLFFILSSNKHPTMNWIEAMTDPKNLVQIAKNV